MARCRMLGMAVLSVLVLAGSACGSSESSSSADEDVSSQSSESAGEDGSSQDDRSLVIVSWGGSFTEATSKFLVEPFEEETGIDVQIIDAAGTQGAQLLAQREAGNIQWDILDGMGAGDAYALEADGLLATASPETLAQYRQEMGDDAVTDFGVAFANVGFVLACTKAVAKCPETIEEFFDTENFPGTRALPGAQPSPLTSILAQAAGVELPADVDVLLDELREIKPHVRVFYTSGDQQEQVLRQGEVDMAVVYNGRAFGLQEEGVELTINWAGTYDPGFTVVVADSPNPAEAREFMDWLVSNPDAQAKWAEFMQYSVAHPEALESLPPEVVSTFPDAPENRAKLGTQDFEWYVENKKEIDEGLNQVIQGG